MLLSIEHPETIAGAGKFSATRNRPFILSATIGFLCAGHHSGHGMQK